VRTTINISDGILSELRELARQRRPPFRVVLQETIQRGLSAPQPPPARKRVRIRTHRVGIKPAYSGLSLNQLYDTDALIALHALEHSAAVISNDRDFDRFAGVKRINPLA